MRTHLKIRPGTGRGTIHGMVEGRERSECCATAPYGRGPSVTPSARHLPVPERNFWEAYGMTHQPTPAVTLNSFQGPSIQAGRSLAAQWMLKQVQHDWLWEKAA